MAILKSDQLPDFFRGDNLDVQYTIKDRDGNPINLTLKTLTFTLKQNTDLGDVDAAIQTTLANDPDQVTNPGVTSLLVEAATTALVTPGRYDYDIQYKDTANGYIETLVRGRVNVLADVTLTP